MMFLCAKYHLPPAGHWALSLPVSQAEGAEAAWDFLISLFSLGWEGGAATSAAPPIFSVSGTISLSVPLSPVK